MKVTNMTEAAIEFRILRIDSDQSSVDEVADVYNDDRCCWQDMLLTNIAIGDEVVSFVPKSHKTVTNIAKS